MYKTDYNNSILNLSTTLADFLGVNNSEVNKLDVLENRLIDAPDNVVFIIFDGLGVYDINELTSDDTFLQDNIVSTITSVVPPTTTSATTTFITAKYPTEHLWLAWSLWLEEQRRVVDIFLDKDEYSREPTEGYYKTNPYNAFYQKKSLNREVYTIFPEYVGESLRTTNNQVAFSLDETFLALNQLLGKPGKKFIYCYSPFPDSLMHEFGVHSKEAKDAFDKIQSELKKIASLKSVRLIVTADHGHIDVKKHIPIYKDEEIMKCLERPLSMEPRHTSFKVKPGMEEFFEKQFNQKYKEDFELYKADDLIKQEVYGKNSSLNKLKEFLGDYISIGKATNAVLLFSPQSHVFKGHHTGGTKEEMEVPLIII